jgi:hypothetical protein
MNKETKKIVIAGVILAVVALFILVIQEPKGTGSISGRVIAEDTGQGVAGVNVKAVRKGNLDSESAAKVDKYRLNSLNLLTAKRALPSVKGTTDKDGRYVLEGAEAGKYVIYFKATNQRYLDAQKQRCLDLHDGEKVVNKDYILRIGGSVSGTIYGSDGRTPLSGVWATAEVQGREKGAGVNDSTRSMLTDGNGRYLLQGLPDSDACIITIEAPGYERLTRKIKIEKGKATADINFIIDKPVVYEDGPTGISVHVQYPIKAHYISLTNELGERMGEFYTDENRAFSSKKILSPGVYKMTIYRPAELGVGDIEIKGILVKEGKKTILNVELNKREPKTWKSYTCE